MVAGPLHCRRTPDASLTLRRAQISSPAPGHRLPRLFAALRSYLPCVIAGPRPAAPRPTATLAPGASSSYSPPPPCSGRLARAPQPSATQENQNTSDKSDDLVRVLRELTVVQRNIAHLQVELQGRKDDKNIAHLTHVSEMEKKCESLARITAILKDVIQNKDRIIARLQQPYSLDCIPVEAEYQKQFSELLLKAASDYGALTASVGDFQWSQNFRESPAVWGEMLRPIPAALASCTRFFEAMSAMRESFSTLQTLRVGPSSLSMTPGGSSDDSKFLTPPQWREGSMLNSWKQVDDVNPESDGLDGINQRRLSWPSSINRDL